VKERQPYTIDAAHSAIWECIDEHLDRLAHDRERRQLLEQLEQDIQKMLRDWGEG